MLFPYTSFSNFPSSSFNLLFSARICFISLLRSLFSTPRFSILVEASELAFCNLWISLSYMSQSCFEVRKESYRTLKSLALPSRILLCYRRRSDRASSSLPIRTSLLSKAFLKSICSDDRSFLSWMSYRSCISSF